jgi:hypothetical protein
VNRASGRGVVPICGIREREGAAMMMKLCEVCGEKFPPRKHWQKRCGTECAKEHASKRLKEAYQEEKRRRRKVMKPCDVCGDKFELVRANQKWCGLKCRKAGSLERNNEARRGRYEANAEYREKVLARNRAPECLERNRHRKRAPDYRERESERRRERYATDLIFRDRKNKAFRDWLAKHGDKYRLRRKARMRERYATDPEFRKLVRDRSRDRSQKPEVKQKNSLRARLRRVQAQLFDAKVLLTKFLAENADVI